MIPHLLATIVINRIWRRSANIARALAIVHANLHCLMRYQPSASRTLIGLEYVFSPPSSASSPMHQSAGWGPRLSPPTRCFIEATIQIRPT